MGKDIRDVFFDELYKSAVIDKKIIVITADADAFGLQQFKENIPDRFINIGVAEQNMINVAAGLALRGKKVFVYSIIPFITMRCFEQIKFNLSGMNLDVVIVGVGTGFSFGFDGPSHHGIIDISIMRSIPNMEIYNPCDENSTINSFHSAYRSITPTYIRLDKGQFDDIYKFEELSKAEDRYIYNHDIVEYKYLTENRNSNILVISTGYTTHVVKEYIKQCPKEIKNISFIDVYKLKEFPDINLKNYKHIIVVDENSWSGGLFTIICENVAINGYNTRVHPITALGIEYLIYGDRKYLLEKNNITSKKIQEVIMGCKNEI